MFPRWGLNQVKMRPNAGADTIGQKYPFETETKSGLKSSGERSLALNKQDE